MISLVEEAVDEILKVIDNDLIREQKNDVDTLKKGLEDTFISFLILSVEERLKKLKGKHCNIETWKKNVVPGLARTFENVVHYLIRRITAAKSKVSIFHWHFTK